jgi:hypothetical protein
MIKYDSLPLQIIETGAGFLKAKVTFAVPGVLPYNYADGLRMEAKLPEDVLSNTTIDSANGAPVTDGHPFDGGIPIAVTPGNYKYLSKGALSNAHVEDGKGVGIITIYDDGLINDIKSGNKTEVSMGFEHDSDSTGGIFNGVKYDSAQRNIRINHLAIVARARAGDKTKINLWGDSMEGGKPFTYRTLDGKREFAVDGKDVQDELLTLNKEIKALNEKIKADGAEMKDMHAKLSATAATKPDDNGEAMKADLLKQIADHEAKEAQLMEQLKAWMDEFNALKDDIPNVVAQEAGNRVDAMQNVKAVDAGAKMDGMTTLDIKKMFIEKVHNGAIKCDGMSADAINARYDAAKEFAKLKAVQFTGNVMGGHVDSKKFEADAASVEQKRNSMANAYDENQKKLRG